MKMEAQKQAFAKAGPALASAAEALARAFSSKGNDEFLAEILVFMKAVKEATKHAGDAAEIANKEVQTQLQGESK